MSGITNRVGKVLVTSGVVATAITDTVAGKVIVLDDKGTILTNTSVVTPDTKFKIAVNDASGKKVESDYIRVKDIVAYNFGAYRAKTEQVYTLTPGTIVAGNEYKIVVIDKSDREILARRQPRRTYSVVASTGETATTLSNKFRDKINADPASVVTASGTATLILTAKAIANTANQAGDFYEQYVFDVFATTAPVVSQSYSQSFENFGTAAITNADYGQGNFWQIRQLERDLIGNTGVSNLTKFPTPSGNFLSTAGVNYDQIIIEHDNEHDTNAVNVGKWKSPITTIVAVTAGSSDDLVAILDNIVNPIDALVARIEDLETP